MIFRGIQRIERGLLTVSLIIALYIGACLFVIGQTRIGLDEGSDDFNLDLLERWNRNAAYDSIQMYLLPKYQIWVKVNPSNIAKTVKYYINGYWTGDITHIRDTLDKYEAIIRDAQGEALTLQFFNVQRANYLLQTGHWDEAKHLVEQTANMSILEEVYPRLAADALGVACFIVLQYGELEKALQYNQRADDVLIKHFGESYYGRVMSLNNFSILSEQLGQHKEGLEYAEQTLRIVREHYSPSHENQFKVLNSLGLKYHGLGQINEAIRIFEQAIQLNIEQGKDVNLYGLYMNISSAYVAKWDYENAEKYLSLAVANLKDKPGNSARQELEINLRRAGMLIDIYRESEALPYLDNVRQIISEKFKGDEYFLASVYALFFVYDMALEDYDSAWSNIEKYLALLAIYVGDNNEEWANGIAWKAYVLNAKTEYDSAHHYMDIALEYYLKSLGNKHNYYLDVQLQKVEAYIKQKKYKKADDILNAILLIDIDENKNSNGFILPEYEDLFKHVNLIKVLQQKIILVDPDMESDELKELEQKAVYYDYLAREFDRIMAMYGGFKTRDDLFSGSEKIFKGAIVNAYKIYDQTKDLSWVETAFQYAERTRSLQFQEIMRDKLAKLEAGIPDSLRAKELELWTQKTSLEEKMQGASQEDSLVYTTISGNLLQATIAYEQFIRRLEAEFSRYYDLKYNVELADIKAVKKHLLNNNKALIQYSIVDSFAYAHVVTRKSFHFIRLPMLEGIDSMVNEYYRLIQTREFARVQELGHELYQCMFAPLEIYLADIQELIIVPDSWLYYVNLESLPTEKPGAPYLLSAYQIQYCYSPTVAVQIKKQPRKKKSDFDWVGFVPGFEENGIELKDKKFAHQPWAMELADSVAVKFNGKLFEGGQANKEAFSVNASAGQILHVGTHAVANDLDPLNSYMVLGGENGNYEQVTAADIFNKRINSKCTVLTACETAVGQIKGGEGMVSLARSFSYAGSPNLVVTLWSVDDQQTASIMRSFYDYIAEGLTFDKSLRLAKLDYLKSARGELKHPFYWAGILYYGTDDQLHDGTFGQYSTLLYSLALAGILLISIFIWRRARN